jgi:hypothetical protein
MELDPAGKFSTPIHNQAPESRFAGLLKHPFFNSVDPLRNLPARPNQRST